MFVIKLRKTFLFFNVKSSCDHGYLLSKDELKISNRLYKIFNLITLLPKVQYPLEEKTQKKKKNNRNNEQCEAFTIVCAILLIHRTHFRFFRVFGLLCILKYILVIFRCCCRLTTFFQSISSIYVKFLLRFRFFFCQGKSHCFQRHMVEFGMDLNTKCTEYLTHFEFFKGFINQL